ncbi:hypothetical protein GGTG_03467 [Gaeumannomyces tritici R3-111a-1]|uniref:Uncharacterized protein n=1 Tax=Gaeumannomyces tritici (strain R3-111a-1) TaxID=644352 RepID=J3NQB0_GAET3|nr:hypothetical protein GGTG_03467 [Gaeumannomyces tritici R3-111a-1]EJT78366.1 hypothetical protein GGTG_03467 [Gaeumannomyces tritici R3-111a-1]
MEAQAGGMECADVPGTFTLGRHLSTRRWTGDNRFLERRRACHTTSRPLFRRRSAQGHSVSCLGRCARLKFADADHWWVESGGWCGCDPGGKLPLSMQGPAWQGRYAEAEWSRVLAKANEHPLNHRLKRQPVCNRRRRLSRSVFRR